MMSKTWTQRIGLAFTTVSLLSFLASQIPTPAATQVLMAEQNGYNVFSVVQTFAAGIVVTGGGITGGPTLQKCINIDPAATTTDWIFWKPKAAITITHIDCLTDVATSTAAITVQECNSSGASCGNTEAAITCSTTNAGESGTIDDSAVAAGNWMRVTRGATANSPTQVEVFVTYTEP